MTTMLPSPVFLALDATSIDDVRIMLDDVAPYIGGIKIGLELFCAIGPENVLLLKQHYQLPLFLDLKFHDIPNTVQAAIKAVHHIAPNFLTVHCSGGQAMLKAANETVLTNTTLLGVTLLTSLNSDDSTAIYNNNSTDDTVLHLAHIASQAGLRGLVCSAHDISNIRRVFGPNITLMVPGIRPHTTNNDDQQRVMTPRQAIEQGANYIVIGRPITQATSPKDAAISITQQLQHG